METADIVVIGGGVMGTSRAFLLPMLPAAQPVHGAVPMRHCVDRARRFGYCARLGGEKPLMLALPVYRAMSCAAVAHARAGPFTVRETTQVTPPKPRLLDRVREAIRARHY